MNKSSFTPTEELVLETLAARTRLGENVWPFSKRSAITKALKSLAERGFIKFEHGPVEYHWRVWLTDKGKDKTISASYVPPILQQVREQAVRKLLNSMTIGQLIAYASEHGG